MEQDLNDIMDSLHLEEDLEMKKLFDNGKPQQIYSILRVCIFVMQGQEVQQVRLEAISNIRGNREASLQYQRQKYVI